MGKNIGYTKKYYKEISENSVSSAREVVSVVLEFIKPGSVADVGCGPGVWLSEMKKKGITDILGFDGEYISDEQLVIDKKNFVRCDLEKEIPTNRKFDLVISLEVAEHIRPDYATSFIGSLCKLSDIILFSAAVPFQEGINHYNEQYPDYWATIFNKFEFTPYDCIREKIWFNKEVSFIYKQNIIFFVKNDAKQKYSLVVQNARPLLPIIHPELYEMKEYIIGSYKRVLRTPFHAAWHFIKAFFRLFKNR
jgi:SAM-dependent methyltransferase